MIPLLCTAVCTAALVALAVTGVLAMRKMRTCEAQGLADADIQAVVAPIVRVSFGAIAIFVVSAAVFLIQGM